MAKGSKMGSRAAGRIQSATARKGGGKVSSGSFASRAQSAAAKNSAKSSRSSGGKGR